MPVEKKRTKAGVKWRWVKMIKGKRHRSLFVYPTKPDAEAALASWWTMYQQTGKPPTLTDSEPSCESVASLLERRVCYLEQHASSRHLKDTKEIFRRAMRFGDFWADSPEDLTTVQVMAWAEQYKSEVSAKAANRALRYLATAFNGPWESKRLPRDYPRNPFLIPLFPEGYRPPYVPPDDDVAACLAVHNDEKGLFLRFLAETGARQGEGRGLRIQDLEADRGLAVLYTRKKKGGHLTPRRVPISAGLASELTAIPANPYFFSQKKGTPRSVRWALNLQIAACKAAEVKYFSLHSYRHWRACKWADEGLRLSQIKYRLGHETLQVTERYLASLGIEVENLQV